MAEVSLHALPTTMWGLWVVKRAALMRTSNVDQKINDLFFKLYAKYQMIDGLLEFDIFYRAIPRDDDLYKPRTLHSEEEFIEFLRVLRRLYFFILKSNQKKNVNQRKQRY